MGGILAKFDQEPISTQDLVHIIIPPSPTQIVTKETKKIEKL